VSFASCCQGGGGVGFGSYLLTVDRVNVFNDPELKLKIFLAIWLYKLKTKVYLLYFKITFLQSWQHVSKAYISLRSFHILSYTIR
jgi:hypothetical protein